MGVTSVAFSADGKTLATASEDEVVGRFGLVVGGCGTVRLWDVSSGQCTATLEAHHVDMTSFMVPGKKHPGKKLSGKVISVAFSTDGKTLATGSEDMTARLWDVSSGQCTAKLEVHHVVMTFCIVSNCPTFLT